MGDWNDSSAQTHQLLCLQINDCWELGTNGNDKQLELNASSLAAVQPQYYPSGSKSPVWEWEWQISSDTSAYMLAATPGVQGFHNEGGD